MRRSLLLALTAAAAIVGGAMFVNAQPYGPGMMGGYGPGYGGGYGPGYGMSPGYGHGWMMGGHGPGMMGGGYGPGMMGGGPGMMGGGYGHGYGPGMMYGQGYTNQGDMKLTPDQVKSYLAQMIRNPNLSVGDVKEKDADTIVAEIVTKDNRGLVQRLYFNRHNGFVQPEQ